MFFPSYYLQPLSPAEPTVFSLFTRFPSLSQPMGSFLSGSEQAAAHLALPFAMMCHRAHGDRSRYIKSQLLCPNNASSLQKGSWTSVSSLSHFITSFPTSIALLNRPGVGLQVEKHQGHGHRLRNSIKSSFSGKSGKRTQPAAHAVQPVWASIWTQLVFSTQHGINNS